MDKLIASIAVRAFYAITFLFMTGIVSTLIIIIPFKCPVLLPLYFLYALWLWVDYETPFKGGRPLKHCYLQRWRLVDLIRQYFPIKLVKTAELDASKNYLFGYHPHGMIPEGALVCFHTKFAGFQQLFPCIYPRVSMVSSFNWLLGFREIALAFGIISVSRDSLEYVLTKKGPGHSVVVIIGGSTEVLNTTPSTYDLILNKRKGFARLALETGSSLVPVFAFGQNDSFHQPKSILPPKVESWLSKWPKIIIKYSLLAYHDIDTWGITPRQQPINVVVGAPIHVTKLPHPTKNQVDELQALYISRLTDIFEQHKTDYGIDKDTHLTLDKIASY